MNLITVPSCGIHNTGKSGDDDYLLWIITSYHDNNLAAQRHFSTKIMRALKRRISPPELFSNPYPARVGGRPTVEFTIDKGRFDQSIECIAKALYFDHYGQKWGGPISVDCPALIKKGGGKPLSKTGYFTFASLSAVTLEAADRLGDNPEIFYYQIHRKMVRMVFYEGFVVTAMSA